MRTGGLPRFLRVYFLPRTAWKIYRFNGCVRTWARPASGYVHKRQAMQAYPAPVGREIFLRIPARPGAKFRLHTGKHGRKKRTQSRFVPIPSFCRVRWHGFPERGYPDQISCKKRKHTAQVVNGAAPCRPISGGESPHGPHNIIQVLQFDISSFLCTIRKG